MNTAMYFEIASKAIETIINNSKPNHAPVPKNKLSKSASASAFTGETRSVVITTPSKNKMIFVFKFSLAITTPPQNRSP